jgi:uncharacterized protein
MSQIIHHSVRNESETAGGRKVVLDIRSNGERIPAVLLLPRSSVPVPVALLLHGLSLDKERMAEMAGPALLRRGIACLALDLPHHGERSRGKDPADSGNPFEMMARWRAALDDSGLVLRFLAQRPDLDPSRISLIGYSLGAFIGLKVAAANREVRSLVLAAGGDLPEYTPFISIVRTVADPIKLVRSLKGRPLLMVHGKYDRAVTPAQAERLFHAAQEPKKMLWWECGHILPPQAMDQAAAWLAEN